ncbi:hypothetical protein ACS0TY_012127 [Phlomoides rotata]
MPYHSLRNCWGYYAFRLVLKIGERCRGVLGKKMVMATIEMRRSLTSGDQGYVWYIEEILY